MRADPPKNMGLLFGGEDYRSRTKIVQAPGGATSIALGYDNTDPFEHKKPGYQKQQDMTPQRKNIYTGFQNSNTPFERRTQSTLPTYNYPLENRSEVVFKNMFQHNPQHTHFSNRLSDADEKAHQANYQSLVQKSWEDAANTMFGKLPAPIMHKSPIAHAYSKQKTEDYKALPSYKDYEPPRNFRTQSYGFESGSQQRSKSQLTTFQNNYNNILNDFSPTLRPTGLYEGSSPTHFRSTTESADSKAFWSGKKITQPPGTRLFIGANILGGGSSIKFGS